MLINVNITDITDESGYIEAIGKKAASQAIQQAEIDVAQQQKKGAIGVAEAEKALELGLYVSFAGPLTYPKNHMLREACAFTPLDRVLVELARALESSLGRHDLRAERIALRRL